ncbi:Vacuolar morphogenesis protein 6 [Psilocybe cubensis]|uniref:Vacuolar morphogenesis protein 6 n=1 Tax=Psilocybe cubensis TaxID=181762 RepID=A0ACB8H242_PSICU|nr:Vacuolar morphogenesis protein 6 [Psilocybe cubensis]KAH9481762.1 Vacuolar morphogenesis protein 6 [Psilocybe cubensis]
MPPFTVPEVVLSGLKEKFDSIAVQADRIYLGSSTGNLHVFGLNEATNAIEPVEVKKGLVRRSIEQLGFLKDVNSLIVLSEMTVTLFPLPTFSPPTPLAKAKAAFSFAVFSTVETVHIPMSPKISDDPDFKRTQPIPTIITQLLVGCRRKAVLYTWKDGEAQDVKEAPLPHSARTIIFLDKDTACFAYSPTEFAMFSIPNMTAVDITTPLPIASSGTAMNALTGLTGYMTLGLGAKAKPALASTRPSEVVIAKDGQGIFIGTDAKSCRNTTIEWPVPPEEISFVKPYLFSVFPAGTLPTQSPKSEVPSTATLPPAAFNTTSVVQIRSSLSLQVSQTLPFPFNVSDATAAQNATIRMLTPSASGFLYAMTTPTDKTAAANEGSSLWRFNMRPWTEQIDELVLDGKYSDALALLDTLDESSISDKEQRRIQIRALDAVSQFRAAKYDAAIDAFIELDFNPAKVVALYPESVAGRLSVPQEGWIPLYGGPSASTRTDTTADAERAPSEGSHDDNASVNIGHEKTATEIFDSIVPAGGSVGGRLRRTGLGMFLPGAHKDDDTASISSKKKSTADDLPRAIETLMRYLSDRRPKLRAALEAVGITPESQSHIASPLSEASVADLFALPNAPLSALTPDQLLRFAQIVDTAMYKSFLINRPILLGSLCRIANWCEVSEVEEDLRARKKYAELRDLYNGKRMHSKALDLLKELSVNVDDMEDKLGPSIQYLQKLGPEYIDQVFTYARWIFDLDSEMAFQIFTSEDVDLPRKDVANYLEKIDPKLCLKYLEYIIEERQEESPVFHDRLAELYLSTTIAAKKRGDEKTRKEVYDKLLQFINSNDTFSIDRLYGYVSSTDLHEARAILLGRLGRHDQALETYVYRLQDYLKAEEYCKRVYQPGSSTAGVFLTLLRIYLRPTVQTTSDLLQPALELISRHSPRLDAVETLQLLPPLVTMDEIREFLIESLRAPVFDTQVIRQISKARDDQLARKLIGLKARRVKVTDSRICPQCHKRLGNSVIAVHAPRGEVTHYQCREQFSRRLQESRV